MYTIESSSTAVSNYQSVPKETHNFWVQKAISFLVPKTYKTFPCRANSANSPTRQPLFDWYTSRHIWRRFCCGPTTKPGVGAWKEWSQNQKYTMNVLTLWLCQNSYWKWLFIDIYSGFSHWKWWVSIVMLVYQRVRFLEIKPWDIKTGFHQLWHSGEHQNSINNLMFIHPNISRCKIMIFGAVSNVHSVTLGEPGCLGLAYMFRNIII